MTKEIKYVICRAVTSAHSLPREEFFSTQIQPEWWTDLTEYAMRFVDLDALLRVTDTYKAIREEPLQMYVKTLIL